jgi:hypothetical protein
MTVCVWGVEDQCVLVDVRQWSKEGGREAYRPPLPMMILASWVTIRARIWMV